MRASDTEREEAAEVLRQALAEGRLTMEEFEERLDSAYGARTDRELERLVRDLPAGVARAGREVVPTDAHEASGIPKSADTRRRWASRIGGEPSSRWGLGFFGGFVRRRAWTVPRLFTGVALLGGGQLDLREARFEGSDVKIRCFAFCGGIQVTVGPDVEVDVTGVGVMGGFDAGAVGPGEPGAPRIVVTGLAVWGGVGVERKPVRPGDGEAEGAGPHGRKERGANCRETKSSTGHNLGLAGSDVGEIAATASQVTS